MVPKWMVDLHKSLDEESCDEYDDNNESEEVQETDALNDRSTHVDVMVGHGTRNDSKTRDSVDQVNVEVPNRLKRKGRPFSTK